MAENFHGQPINRAVIAVPSCQSPPPGDVQTLILLVDFNDNQRQAIRNVAQIAELQVLRVIDEPNAALIAFRLDRVTDWPKVLVYDLGATFDASVFEVEDGVFELLASTGDAHIGGPRFNGRIFEQLDRLYTDETGTSIPGDPNKIQDIWAQVEGAKLILSESDATEIMVPSEDGTTFKMSLTVSEFNDLNADLFNETLRLVDQALNDAGFNRTDLDQVSCNSLLSYPNSNMAFGQIFLVGGSSSIPRIRHLLHNNFPDVKLVFGDAFAVVRGAATKAGMWRTSDSVPDDYCVHTSIVPMNVGIEIEGGILSTVFPRNSILPGRRSKK